MDSIGLLILFNSIKCKTGLQDSGVVAGTEMGKWQIRSVFPF